MVVVALCHTDAYTLDGLDPEGKKQKTFLQEIYVIN